MPFKKLNNYKKPTLTFLLLKAVFDLGAGTVDSFLPAQYPQAKMWRQILGLGKSYKILKKKGLIEREKGKWNITNLGAKIVKGTKFRPSELPEKDGVIRLVIFDIPEKERKKRLWLRLELLACDYGLLQKSVWVGYCPLPKDFLDSLEYLNLRPYVQIFSIKHSGTLKEENY